MTAPAAALIDAGPYSARNSSKGALLIEAAAVVGALADGVPFPELRQKAMKGALLSQRARSTRKRIWDALHHRLFSPRWPFVLDDIVLARRLGPASEEFVSLVYLHYALRDRLTFDVITTLLFDRACAQRSAIDRADVLGFLDNAATREPELKRFSESSRRKIASNLLTALRDFGLIRGAQRKQLLPPRAPLSTVAHLLRILVTEGAAGAQALHHPAWRLFFFTPDDVAHALHQLAQQRHIGFERAGDTVVLHPPAAWRPLP